MCKCLILLFLCMKIVTSQREYESCTYNHNTEGQCRKFIECRSAFDDFRWYARRPTFCSSRPNETPVVCCRDAYFNYQTQIHTSAIPPFFQASTHQASPISNSGLNNIQGANNGQAVNTQEVNTPSINTQSINTQGNTNLQPINTQGNTNLQPINTQSNNVQSVNTQPNNMQSDNTQPNNVQSVNTQSNNVQSVNTQLNNMQSANTQGDNNMQSVNTQGFNNIQMQPENEESINKYGNNNEQAVNNIQPVNVQVGVNNTQTDSVQAGFSKRISDIKCEQYSSMVIENIDYNPLVLDEQETKLSCNFKASGDVVFVEQLEFSHVVDILWPRLGGGYEKGCAGSIISERFVVTAARCTTIRNDISTAVRTNEPTKVMLRNRITIPIAKLNSHPAYKSLLFYNDIALIELAKNINFGIDIRPACLWSRSPPNRKATAIVREIEPREFRKKVTLEFVDSKTCDSHLADFRSRTWPNGLDKGQMCASVTGDGSTCQGYSGGPLQITTAENYCVFYVVGMTTFNGNCAAENLPTVFTKIAEYVDWIEGIVWPQG